MSPLVVAGRRRRVVSDSFNRADSFVSLGTADTGQVWTARGGTWGVVSNRAQHISGGGSSPFASLDAGFADFRAAELDLLDATASQWLVFRLVDSSNYMIAGFGASSTTIQVFRVLAGAFTSLGTAAAGARIGRIKVVARGTAIVVSFDGVPLLNLTSSANLAGTEVGMLGPSVFDNLLVTP